MSGVRVFYALELAKSNVERPPRGSDRISGAGLRRLARSSEVIRRPTTCCRRWPGEISSPPTLAFRFFKIATASLRRAGGPPNRIDRSAWSNMPVTPSNDEILSALRFLGLIDEGARPTARLVVQAQACETDAWPREMDALLRSAYSEFLALGLQRAPPKSALDLIRARDRRNPQPERPAAAFFARASVTVV